MAGAGCSPAWLVCVLGGWPGRSRLGGLCVWHFVSDAATSLWFGVVTGAFVPRCCSCGPAKRGCGLMGSGGGLLEAPPSGRCALAGWGVWGWGPAGGHVSSPLPCFFLGGPLGVGGGCVPCYPPAWGPPAGVGAGEG